MLEFQFFLAFILLTDKKDRPNQRFQGMMLEAMCFEGPDKRALGKVGTISESKVSKSFDCRDGFVHKGVWSD